MGLPSPDNKVWADIITGSKKVDFEFLAARIFLGTAQMKVKNDPSALKQQAGDLFKLLEKNQNLPSVQKDIAKL